MIKRWLVDVDRWMECQADKGVIRPKKALLWDLNMQMMESASKALCFNCDRYRALPWWNIVKWFSLARIYQIRIRARNLLKVNEELQR